MSGDAVAMMVLAMVVLWGGLGAAIVNIVRFKGREPQESMRDL
ncbi:Putative methionine and alanine importer, small subunit [Agrococcus baldri]|uniref:Methionine and alanine importer, small subunit n=1 Tax=Agrococcus baldri TaxID=153730 RepID=A0AA94HLJ5_9MICO|nr:methionine/alanine import family NSS transporter small subunit [Agrococcus baldri]SFS07269.1 Putative methionine and alanine importer, small subunit [Agrococcus baldri]